jgi:lycopene beta-cyclase
MGDFATPWDAVIVGGGAAGLSLACHLASAGWGERVAIVDDGAFPVESRAWAWWQARDGLLSDAATSVYGYLDAAGPGWTSRAPLAPYTYRSITGAALCAAADAAMESLPGFVRMSGRAVAIEQGGGAAVVVVEGTDGRVERLNATWVFDSVGVGTVPPDPRLAPHLDFLGLCVESGRDVFDPAAVTLMDFRTDQADGVAFVYVLPTSARKALVERTVFVHPRARERVASSCHDAELQTYLRDVLQVPDARTSEGEKGVIPLVTLKAARCRGRVIPIGTQAGMVRASTGYAFERIQSHNAEIARRLVAGLHPGLAVRAERWQQILDAALLRVIKEDPDAVRNAFAAMLARNPARRTLAFLDGRASLIDQIRIVASLPLWRFAWAQVTATLSSHLP